MTGTTACSFISLTGGLLLSATRTTANTPPAWTCAQEDPEQLCRRLMRGSHWVLLFLKVGRSSWHRDASSLAPFI